MCAHYLSGVLLAAFDRGSLAVSYMLGFMTSLTCHWMLPLTVGPGTEAGLDGGFCSRPAGTVTVRSPTSGHQVQPQAAEGTARQPESEVEEPDADEREHSKEGDRRPCGGVAFSSHTTKSSSNPREWPGLDRAAEEKMEEEAEHEEKRGDERIGEKNKEHKIIADQSRAEPRG